MKWKNNITQLQQKKGKPYIQFFEPDNTGYRIWYGFTLVSTGRNEKIAALDMNCWILSIHSYTV